jgi:transcriptional regulator with XRE-family HTH domain
VTKLINIVRPGPSNDPGAVSEAIARNVRQLRAARRWTLEQLAMRSGVSKGMVVQIERGATNPSIATLCRLANAFGVTVPRLVEVAEGPRVRLVRADDAVTLWRGRAGSVARLLVGVDVPELTELWEWRLAPGDTYAGEAHPGGTHEILHVLEGSLTLQVDRSRHEARRGETIAFRADRPHTYANEGKGVVRFIMVVLEPRPAAGPVTEAGEKSRARRRPR